jgi:type I restriction enzyme M protein
MQWIAATRTDSATETLEKRLWEAADQLRANSGLIAAQYSTPVLGLIVLRLAEAWFAKRIFTARATYCYHGYFPVNTST